MARSARLLVVLLLALACAMPAAALAADPLPDGAVRTDGGRVLPPLPDELEQPSVHAEMLSDHAGDGMRFKVGGEPSVLLDAAGTPQMASSAVEPMGTLSEGVRTAALPNGLRKQVFGFLPYWMLTDAALSSMNYQLVSTIAYFSVNANKDGNLVKGTSSSPSTGWAGWNSSRMTEVINRAHANGAKVVLTVTMMAWDSASANRQAVLLGSSTARARLVSQIVGAVRARGADGVNLDFEPLATSLRDEYVSFARQLKRGLVNAGVGDYLTVCVMAGAATWATGYDVAGLTAAGAADGLFVMGYDYHWSGSSRAGGVAPIQSPYTLDVASSMADFLTETSGSKLIWGVPYYGRTWPTSSSKLNSTTLGGGSKSYMYTGHLAQAAQYGRRWDDVGKVPWYRHWDGAAGRWVQGYYDDVASLGVKYDLINARGLAGTGMWTLLMDQGRDELWRLLAAKFVRDSAPPVGGISLMAPSTDAEALVVRWRAADYASGVSHYNLQVRRDGGAWQSWISGTKKTAAWFTGTAGSKYEFRVRAFDLKGNGQQWITVPAKPAALKVNAFARVASASLNVRSGPGTSYGSVATAAQGDVMYVLEGPVSAGGYSWYRVQYGFSEWPSADYPLIAWVAGKDSSTTYLAPRQAPTVTRLSPFVVQTGRTASFSPNGDGAQDEARVDYTLKAAAIDVRLDVLDASGSVVRALALGPQAVGPNSATWNGRVTGGAWATAGRYLLRITAVGTDGATHTGPAAGFSAALLNRWAVTADLTAPQVGGSPTAAAQMVPAKRNVVVTFSEPVANLAASRLKLRVDGLDLPTALSVAGDATRATLNPVDPLPVDAAVELWLSDTLHDSAGNPLASGGWTFLSAPGAVYDPSRRAVTTAGTHTGYAIAQDGDLLTAVSASLSRTKEANVGQRATLPNLPGRWLLLESGPLRGRWVRESGNRYLKGEAERHMYASTLTLRLQPAVHVAHRFDGAGTVTAARGLRLVHAVTVHATARAIINGRAHWRIADGTLAGYWLAESSVAYRRGTVGKLVFPGQPRIDVAAGTYTGYRYDSAGRRLSSVSARLGSTTRMRVSAWAVIDGRPHFLVANGTFAGTWLPETKATRLHV